MKTYCSCIDEVIKDLAYQRSLREAYRKKLWSYDKYKSNQLVRSSSRGHGYYSLRTIGAAEKPRYLGGDRHPLVKALQLRDYYSECLLDVEINIKWLEKLVVHYHSMDPGTRIRALNDKGRLRAMIPQEREELFEIAGAVDAEVWQNAPYPKSERHPENLIHKTMRGEYVRSKSEVIIANALYQAGIPYRYEQITEFGGVVIAADFIVLSVRRQKFLVWEHFGRMNDPEYQKSYLWKLRKYAKAGLVVGVDLLTTFDDADGAIDAGQVKKYIEEVIL